MKRKERLQTQIAEVEARLGVAPASVPLAASDEVAAGMGTPRAGSVTPHRLPPLSPLSPGTGGTQAAAKEVEMLQQVRLYPFP